MSKTKQVSRRIKRVFQLPTGEDLADAIDIEKREVTFSLSSEAPIQDFPGTFTILSHEDGAIRTDRLKTSAPILFNHNRDIHLGKAVDFSITDRKLRVVARFGRGAVASEKFQDVQDGILTEVSVSAKIHEEVLEASTSDGVDTYRATDWEPLEASFVTVPADISVGIGRSAENNADEKPNISKRENITMSKESEKTPEKVIEIDHEAVNRGVKAEQNRVGEIHRLGAAHKVDAKNIQAAVESGAPLEDFQRSILADLGAKPIATPDSQEVGLSRKEKKEYSLLRGLSNQVAMLTGERQIDGIEREVSDAIAQKVGRSAKGLFIPMADLEVSNRDMSAGVAAKGGYTVGTDIQGSSMIKLLRNKMAVIGMGARSLTGLQGDLAIPKVNGGATAYWLGEGAECPSSDQNFAQLGLTPKRLAAVTAYTKQLLNQSSIGMEAFVRDDLMQILALEKDRAALYGTGASGEPLGIAETDGINTVTFGAAPTWAKVVEFETNIATDNADVNSMRYLTTPGVRGAWKTTLKASSTAGYIWETNESPVNGYGATASNQVANNQVFFGDWSQLIVADWEGLDIVVDPYTLAANGKIRIVMQTLTDLAIRHAESFCVSTDAGNQ